MDGFPTILLCSFKDEEKVYGEGDCVSTSIEENDLTAKLKLYPNPVTDKLNLKLDEAIQDGRLEVFSQTGEIIYHKSGWISSSEIIDLNQISQGIYFVRIFNDKNGKVLTNKIVKIE